MLGGASNTNRRREQRDATNTVEEIAALHINKADSEARYSRLIRFHLLNNYGVPVLTRHTVHDKAGTGSLRRP
jgi:hypothetical protein